MWKRSIRRVVPILTALAALALAGCASVPLSPPGPYADLTPQDAVNTANVGARVRWGGEIISTTPKTDRTCFVVLALPLYAGGEPSNSQTRTLGRFVACSPGFYDPALYTPGRQITIAGNIQRFENRKVGGYDYRMPVIDSGAPHLWPIEPRVQYVTPACDPFCSPLIWPRVYYYYPRRH